MKSKDKYKVQRFIYGVTGGADYVYKLSKKTGKMRLVKVRKKSK